MQLRSAGHEEPETVDDAALLVEVMERREAIDAAAGDARPDRGAAALREQARDAQTELCALERQLGQAFDVERDAAAARRLTNRMAYVRTILSEIQARLPVES